MKKLTAVILALVILLALTACAQESEPETEILYLCTEVVHEITPDHILKTVYHFDKNWSSLGYTSYMNDQLDQEVTYKYDEQGNTIRMTAVSGGITSVVEYKNTYDENGNLIYRETFNDGVAGSVDEFTYDEEGNRISQTSTNNHPTMGLWISAFTFDADGNMLSMSNTVEGTAEYPGHGTFVTYKYDEYGNQIESVQTGYTNDPGAVAGAGSTVSEVKDGKITKTTSYDPEGNVTEIREFTWDGNVQTESVYDPNGTLALTGTRTYDDAGNLLVSETVTEYSTQRSTYTYQKVERPAE